jgi:hypothetical protein
MSHITTKIKENIADRIADVFWVAVKAAAIAVVILLLLKVFPINVEVRQGDRFWRVDTSGW